MSNAIAMLLIFLADASVGEDAKVRFERHPSPAFLGTYLNYLQMKSPPVFGGKLKSPGKLETPVNPPESKLRAKVLDVFGSDHLLLSFGSDQGLGKGMTGILYWGEPMRFHSVEFVKVGADHSLARIRAYGYTTSLAPNTTPLQADEAVTWFSFVRPPTSQRWIEIGPTHMRPGGAIIDLTNQKK